MFRYIDTNLVWLADKAYARDKHFSLLCSCVSDEEKKFYKIELRLQNFQRLVKFLPNEALTSPFRNKCHRGSAVACR